VVALEVSASSPFPAGDTCHGWRVVHRAEDRLKVLLVISSQSAVMAHIAERFDVHDREVYEVWASVDGGMILLSGFGEGSRRGRNRLRLARMAGLIAYCLALLVLLAAVAAGAKYLELQQVRETAERVRASSQEVVELREVLSQSRLMVDTASELRQRYPSPLAEMERIATVLDNDTWVSMAELRGNTLRIEGQSTDASAVMQQLLDHPAYTSVEAPAAFKKVRSGMERFVLDLTLATEAPEE
jgi:general secretion pathway protein L